MNQIIDFFISGKRTQSESLIKYRTKFMNILVLFTAIITFVMSIVRFYREDYFVSFVDLIVSIVTLYMIYLIKIKPQHLDNVIKIFLTIFFIFTFVLIIKVEYEAKMALPFMLLSSTIFLQGKRAGFFWFIAIISTILVLKFSSIIDFNFSNISIVMMLFLLLCHYLVLLLYENQQEESNQKLEEIVFVQKEALDNFKILIDSTIEAVLVFAKEEGVIECNRVGLEMFGYTKKQVLGKSIFDFVYEDDIKTVQEMMKLERAEPYEIRALDSEGKIMPVLVSGADMYFNEKPVRVVTVFDLTELKQKDKLLQLKSRHAVMGEMIGMIAHQWRQPLSAISGSVGVLSLDLMMDTYNKESFQNQIDSIGEHTQFLSTTIDDFRNFFKENKEKSNTTLEEIVESSLTIIGSTLENQKIELIKDYQSNESFYTYANELKQVVLNLIKNAQDALLDNEISMPKITISTYKEKKQFILSISDNGGGISADIMDNIFEPYFTTKEKRDGTGLGLYMSKTIIQEHCGGSITVSNGKFGAQFKIILKEE